MIKDFGDFYFHNQKYSDPFDLSILKPLVYSGELLKKFSDWRDSMWKKRISAEGKHDGTDAKYYKNPSLYGYQYRKSFKSEL